MNTQRSGSPLNPREMPAEARIPTFREYASSLDKLAITLRDKAAVIDSCISRRPASPAREGKPLPPTGLLQQLNETMAILTEVEELLGVIANDLCGAI